MSKRDMRIVREITEMDGVLVEANDVSALSLLKGKPHVVGPLINTYNEGTLKFLHENGAVRITLPVELSKDAIAKMAASQPDIELEVFAYGRLPLALSARCYHARSHGLNKDSCQFVCDQDADGMDVDTLDGDPFLVVNGLQTLSYKCCNMIHDVHRLSQIGVNRFRISPQSWDMVAVAQCFRDTLDGTISYDEADDLLIRISNYIPSSNGYLYAKEGMMWVGNNMDME
jgi:collagenase-like PrtC family protease